MDRAADNLVPFQVSLELTHRCNLSCQHCYIDTRLREELSLSEMKSVLDQLAKAGTMYLLFTGGEPLVRQDFFDIVYYAKEKGFLFMLLTNGTLITPEVARKIAQLEPVSVGMSLHGATAVTHDSITRKSGSFKALIRAFHLLKELDVNVMLHSILMNLNVNEAERMKELCHMLGAYLHIGYEIIPTREGSSAPFQYEASLTELCENYSKDWFEDNSTVTETSGVCKAGKGICSVSPNGDVFPCLLMPMKVGNLRKEKFVDIWQNNPCTELVYLRSITWDDLSNCKDCQLAMHCKRCMGVAYAETGELTKPAPSACRNAATRSELFKQKGVIT